MTIGRKRECPKMGLDFVEEFDCVNCQFRRICVYQFRKFENIRDTYNARKIVYPYGITREKILPKMKIHQHEAIWR